MAGLPLNTFKNITYNVTTTLTPVYQAPLGITSIVLMAQVANVVDQPVTVSFFYQSFSDFQQSIQPTYLLRQAIVPPNDALMLIGGKLVLQTNDYIYIQASTNSSLQLVASILETANQ